MPGKKTYKELRLKLPCFKLYNDNGDTQIISFTSLSINALHWSLIGDTRICVDMPHEIIGVGWHMIKNHLPFYPFVQVNASNKLVNIEKYSYISVLTDEPECKDVIVSDAEVIEDNRCAIGFYRTLRYVNGK